MKYISFFIMTIFFSVVLNFVNAYATNVVTSDNFNIIEHKQVAIVSSKGDGEIFTKTIDLASAPKLHTPDNKDFIGKFVKVIIKDNNPVPVYSNILKSEIIGNIDYELKVLIEDIEGNFVKILFNDEKGFLEKSNLEMYKITSEDTSKKDEDYKEPLQYVKVISENGANLMENNSVNSEILKKLKMDSYSVFLEKSDRFVKVKDEMGIIGYLELDYIAFTDRNEDYFLNPKAIDIINFAKKHLGKPYIYGSTDLSLGTDCSGFTYSIFNEFGINLNRISRDQFLNGINVEKSDILPADLVFFNTGGNSTISHVGIYIGDNKYIHSTDSKGQGVIISDLDNQYALKNYYGARRVLN